MKIGSGVQSGGYLQFRQGIGIFKNLDAGVVGVDRILGRLRTGESTSDGGHGFDLSNGKLRLGDQGAK